MDFQARVLQCLGETSGTSKTGKPWKKKEWVVETPGQYPRTVKVQCFNDRADNLILENGKDYNLFVDIESREFNGRWYTDVSVYRADEINSQNYSQGNFQPQSFQQGGFNNAPYGGGQGDFQNGQSFSPSVQESDEDLPF